MNTNKIKAIGCIVAIVLAFTVTNDTLAMGLGIAGGYLMLDTLNWLLS